MWDASFGNELLIVVTGGSIGIDVFLTFGRAEFRTIFRAPFLFTPVDATVNPPPVNPPPVDPPPVNPPPVNPPPVNPHSSVASKNRQLWAATLQHMKRKVLGRTDERHAPFLVEPVDESVSSNESEMSVSIRSMASLVDKQPSL